MYVPQSFVFSWVGGGWGGRGGGGGREGGHGEGGGGEKGRRVRGGGGCLRKLDAIRKGSVIRSVFSYELVPARATTLLFRKNALWLSRVAS